MKSEHSVVVVGLAAVTLVVLFILGTGAVMENYHKIAHMWQTQPTGSDLIAAGWDYIPGVNVQPDGLHVTYVGRSIVKQTGVFGQLDPAVNLYGARLEFDGDIEIVAQMTNVHGSATIRFYALPPVVQDEFRVETPSLEVTISPRSITAAVWSGYDHEKLTEQHPASRTYPLRDVRSARMLSVRFHGSNAFISVDGDQPIVVAVKKMTTQQLWIGLESRQPADSWTVSSLRVTPQTGTTLKIIDTRKSLPLPKSDDGLQMLASQRRPGFMIGAAAALGPVVADEAYASRLLGGNFGQITPENMLKWQFIQPQPGKYTFEYADALIDIALKNHLTVHGHALVFGEANPLWLQSLPRTTAADKAHIQWVMREYINHTMRHFRGRIASWDVVNEPLADEVTDRNPYRQNIWYQSNGVEYIAAALREARQSDPAAKLYINEFGLEEDGDRWRVFLSLLQQLQRQQVPLDGIGFQSHVYESDDAIDAATLRRHIRTLASMGLESRISEMDVYSNDGSARQAAQYYDVFSVCIAEPSCVSWTTWGVSNRYDMWSKRGRLAFGKDLLWDDHMKPTPAYYQIRDSLSRTPRVR